MAIFAKNLSFAAFFSSLVLLLHSLQPTEARLGVCYGMKADNLPSKQDVINLYKSKNVGLMRIYNQDGPTMEALKGSNIGLMIGVPNESIQDIATDQSKADNWIQSNVAPYASSVNIKYIAVGNEIHPDQKEAQYISPAMENILNALNSAQLGGGGIQVSTAIDMSLIANSYPPSSGTFTNLRYMSPISKFLESNGFPLLLNAYPYFAYIGSKSIPIDYVMGSSSGMKIDGLVYTSLLDAMVDSVYAALSKVDASNTRIVVSETGWPSEGGDFATVDFANRYYNNMINRVNQGLGTPKKPNQPLETYLFAMFDERDKPGAETERHFGLFHPNQQPKYDLPSIY